MPQNQPFTRLTPGLILLALSLATSACDESQVQPVERTEPWRKDEAGLKANSADKSTLYRVVAGQSLELSLPTRKYKPTGTLGGIQGEVRFTLGDLASTKGKLTFDVSTIRIRPSTEATRNEPERSSSTTRALRWLGLGEKVSEAAKENNAKATFEFHSLRALSHVSAGIGQRKKKDDGGVRRQVYATAAGELSLRGLSVQRQFSTTLHFHYAPEATRKEPPTSIEVTLRGGAKVPLAEYEILPRDASGHPIAEERKIIGSEVGTNAQLSGTLRLEKASD